MGAGKTLDCLTAGAAGGIDGMREPRHPGMSRIDPKGATRGGPLSGPLEAQKD